MNRFRLHTPQISPGIAYFSWEVDPPSALYRKSDFFLKFPDGIDLTQVPAGLWGLIALFCLHPHWVLLRPCRVELPFTPDTGQLELWNRLLDAALTTLAVHSGRTNFERSIEFQCAGPSYPVPVPLASSNRCATAFSGGKDSLLQTGLLTELSRKPVLVTTTSPAPPKEDHLTERRRYVFREIAARRDVTFIEVTSDLRATIDNDFPHAAAGFLTSVTELTDTFLYFSSLLAASVALGVTHLFMASEAEVQESTERDGRTIQHRHFMYSAVTQRAMAVLLGAYGIQFCSLTSPLYASLVHRLLWTRYRDLRDLQYSCWRVRRGESCCNQCPDCLKYVFAILALGDRPARMGLEPGKVIRSQRDWAPRLINPENAVPTPSEVSSQINSHHIMTNVRHSTLASYLRAMVLDSPRELISARGYEAIRCFRGLKKRLDPLAPTALPGYRKGFLEMIDPLVRDQVGAIFEKHFAEEPENEYADLLMRSRKLADWICEPVTGSFSQA